MSLKYEPASEPLRRRCETHVAYRDADRIYHFLCALPSSA